VFSTDGRSLEEVIGELLVSRRLRIALAESCTGGLATSRLTDVPGSSAYVEQSVIAYSNAAKTTRLSVPATFIEQEGAVSEPIASAMATSIRDQAQVDIGVGITGIAGPGGGSDEKPVGTVCIAVATRMDTVVRTFRFPGNRELVKTFAAFTALDLVRRTLLQSPPNADWIRA
jgi:nicotinamide-nucleotide amidase